MHTYRGLLTALSLMTSMCGGCYAAQFQVIELPDGGGHSILMSGVILPGDETTFHSLAEPLGKAVVMTTGPGGSVGPALAIGSETRARGWSTLVPAGASCASACSMIWLAGQTRMLGVGARIGFHAIATSQNGQRAETHAMDIYLERWLTELGYPLDTTATIVNTHAASIRWYDAIELRANGIATDLYP